MAAGKLGSWAQASVCLWSKVGDARGSQISLPLTLGIMQGSHGRGSSLRAFVPVLTLRFKGVISHSAPSFCYSTHPEGEMLSKMSSHPGAHANYNVRLPTDIHIVRGRYYSVSKLLEQMRSIVQRHLLEMGIKVIRDAPTSDQPNRNQMILADQSKAEADGGER